MDCVKCVPNCYSVLILDYASYLFSSSKDGSAFLRLALIRTGIFDLNTTTLKVPKPDKLIFYETSSA